jgi:hypothetical protein
MDLACRACVTDQSHFGRCAAVLLAQRGDVIESNNLSATTLRPVGAVPAKRELWRLSTFEFILQYK